MTRNRKTDIYRVSIAGSGVNVALMLLKFVAGFFGKSSAMIADAVHSLADCLSDLIVILFVKLGSRPKDRNHDYGYGKYETLATGIIGLILLGIGIAICYESIEKVMDAIAGRPLGQPRLIALVVAIMSVLMKEWVFRFMHRVGERWNSDAVIANAWHHRSDALSSICTTLGIAGAILLGPRWAVLDPIAAIVMGLIIIRMAYKLVSQAVGELTEHAIPEAQKEAARRVVEAEEQVAGVLQLKTRKIGNDIAIDLCIAMPPGLTLADTYVHTQRIEQRLKAELGEHTQVNIQVNPA
ncbi:cation diffusion facilitator family transporter [Prevotella sp. KH2C16]|uniref:cation diffusion facilitator family transporter n=1 Tax=Prevotella sp. KH2C16 TaxID=1855325 RepID=UPI0008E5AF92|nr:cation diffusion facilitator family transporter [Prevotella sp. KH2C16]SFF83750.1 cation diffusion facilitator family transporter [Prevotella sp. KH2C16]